ncbi:glycoside-pentoside-hexuronide (GPH):cation symporter [Treponema pedis]|uniref:MFS transporter n=1 Tax=Treponema pedis TaxID=409322 RepID=A0A7S6WM73_9SPIR|nr:glycoside-pentoside-hexuronide (GPH):cation symporter [Treponema pedis]QOW59740.1 MFS transporter [Treponema pedis]
MNKLFYGIGTIGRDMVYALTNMYLIYYITEALSLPPQLIITIGFIMTVLRIFDALNDPFMGVIIDNTKSRFGKFKPWILIGAVLSGIFTVLIFTDFKLTGAAYVAVFTFLYLFWGISYTANDISYWSMLPSLSQNQKEREKIGSIARIFANLGLFTVVVGIVPAKKFLTAQLGNEKTAYFLIATALSTIMLFFQIIMLAGTKENKNLKTVKRTTPVKELFSVIVKNDQLLWITVSMALFMIGYMTTTTFGIYYFEFIFRDIDMYGKFAAVLGLSQIAALAVFPQVSKFLTRKKIYRYAIISVTAGYILFYIFGKFSVAVLTSGILIFFGQAFIQLLMLMFIADSVEYGELKLGRRNDSITFSLQPLINKIGGAAAALAVSITVSYYKKAFAAEGSAYPNGETVFKFAMLILPLVCMLIGYFIYEKKYIIDEKKYSEILGKLNSE